MPDFITMAAIATGATTANMPAAATTTRGCWSRNWRRMGNSLHTLLAAIAIASRLLRTLYAGKCTARCRPADSCGVLHWSRRGSGNINGAFATKVIDLSATRGRGAGTIN